MFPRYDPKKEFWRFFGANLVSGGLAGAGSLLIVYPLDYLHTRLAADVGTDEKRQFTGVTDCIKKTFDTDGITGFYQGLFVSILGIFVYRAAYFGLYDLAMGMVFRLKNGKDNFILKFMVAQAVTVVSGLLVYPFDTIRRCLMMQAGEKTKLYDGPIDCCRVIHKEEGIQGFFKEALGNSLRTIGGAFVLVCYDMITNSFWKK